MTVLAMRLPGERCWRTHSAKNVFSMRHDIKVRRIYTRRVAAEMIDFHALWDCNGGELQRHMMGKPRAAI